MTSDGKENMDTHSTHSITLPEDVTALYREVSDRLKDERRINLPPESIMRAHLTRVKKKVLDELYKICVKASNLAADKVGELFNQK